MTKLFGSQRVSSSGRDQDAGPVGRPPRADLDGPFAEPVGAIQDRTVRRSRVDDIEVGLEAPIEDEVADDASDELPFGLSSSDDQMQ